MTFYDNFISICKLRNIPAGTVCSDCGLSQGIHSKWKDSVPKSDAIIKIAKYLNVSIDYLLTGKDVSIPTEYQSLISSYEQLSNNNKQLLNCIISSMIEIQTSNEKRSEIKLSTRDIRLMTNKVSAGTGYNLEGADFVTIQVINTPEAQKADYAVTVEGESMSPDFHEGDIILVKKQSSIEKGQVGIFIFNNEGFIKEAGDGCLISRNPKFKNIVPKEDDQIVCIGLVIGKAELVE